VAPPDTEREHAAQPLQLAADSAWRLRQRRGGQQRRPLLRAARAQAMAGAWGSGLLEIGARGHINGVGPGRLA
jgi:predicted alpha/beta hydrolase family esterase